MSKTKNYTAIDAWIPGIGAFQMTVGKNHDIKTGAKDWYLPCMYDTEELIQDRIRNSFPHLIFDESVIRLRGIRIYLDMFADELVGKHKIISSSSIFFKAATFRLQFCSEHPNSQLMINNNHAVVFFQILVSAFDGGGP